MRTKHATEIRKGILTARERPWKPGVLTILNTRHYSKLAFEAFNVYRRRHLRSDVDNGS